SFGKNGRTWALIDAIAVLARADGKLLIVGNARPRNPEFSDADGINYIVRLNADGRVDTTFGDSGFVDIGDFVFSDGITGITASITSAGLDNAGRLLVGFSQSIS